MSRAEPTPRASFALRAYPRAFVGAVLVVLVAGTIFGSGAGTATGRLGGDFPSFYGAGSIVAEGEGDRLYDPALQTQVQAELFGEDTGFLYFAYPPYYAYPYAALSLLPFRVAFLVHALFLMLALWLAVRLAAPLLPRLLGSRDRRMAALAVLLASYPMLRSVLGGQNTPFTVLLIVAVWRFAEDERDLAAGLALSVLLYKPQFGLPLLALVVVARRWRIVTWWALGAAGLYLAGAAMLGPGWVQDWLEQVAPFNDLNLAANGDLMVSAAGWWQNLLEQPQALVLAGLSIVVAAAVAAAVWWRRGLSSIAVALAAPVIVIVAPSALYYDAAIGMVAFGAAIELRAAAAWYALAAFVALSYTQLAASTLGWSPLFPLLAATLLWAIVAYSTSREPSGVTRV
ncbi:MAG: hypothetical protein BMS9Abin07_1458 [Acidimicrobiia bacterium]|nr:MAG: hypothetical protein BMS9Abin07_1458 [Acidimicrobiia bacterium]